MTKSTIGTAIKAAQAELATLQKALETAQQWAPTTAQARRLAPVIMSVWNARVTADTAAEEG